MEALLGGATILVLLAALLSGRASAPVALIAIPVIAALIGGHGAGVGGFVLKGVQAIAPVVGMLVFAILYFGVLTDAGFFRPIVRVVLRIAGRSPPRVVLATAVLASIVHLDGAGAVTFLLTLTAFLPLYDELRLDRRVLACATAMAAGVANLLPWGGPTLRAATSLGVPVTHVFNPLIPAALVGLAMAYGFAWWLGLREARRLARGEVGRAVVGGGVPAGEGAAVRVSGEAKEALASNTPAAATGGAPFAFNAALTILVLATLVSGIVPPVVVFMAGTVIALVVNRPSPAAQLACLDAHAKPAMMMATVLFAAGAFTGVMKHAGFLDALSRTAVTVVPESVAAHAPLVMAVLSVPMSLLFDPDSFYFGVMPVVAQTASHFGVEPVAVAQGALMGQMTTGFPISPLTPSTFLLVGLAGIGLGAHQRFTFPLLFAISLGMTLVCLLLGTFGI